MKILLLFTIAAVAFSLIKDRQRTWLGVKAGLSMFFNLLPSLFNVLILVAFVLSLVPQSRIVELLGKESNIGSYGLAALIGSISLIPGFIAFPLSGILVKAGVQPGVIAVFITTLMMVGVLTLPIEIAFFGKRIALLRNGLCFAGALIIGSIMALVL